MLGTKTVEDAIERCLFSYTTTTLLLAELTHTYSIIMVVSFFLRILGYFISNSTFFFKANHHNTLFSPAFTSPRHAPSSSQQHCEDMVFS